MFLWLSRQRARIEHVDAEAEALIGYFGAEAYSEARRRELEASSDAIAEDWDRVALIVARKTEGRALRRARDDERLTALNGKPQKPPVDPIDELKRIIGEEMETGASRSLIVAAGPRAGGEP